MSARLSDGSPSSDTPLSADGLSADGLTPDQRERLAVLLERYMSALEQGQPLDAENLIHDHPDLADSLRSCFRSLNDLHDIAAGFGNATGGQAEQTAAEHNDERRIGDFRLVREVGRGGMGVVYEAWQVSLNRRVALKVLPFAAVLDAKQIARFRNEAQAAAQIQHPRIVPVFAIGSERGVHYYAMQFIDGQPLNRAIDDLRRAGGLEPTHAPSSPVGTPGPAPSVESNLPASAVDSVIRDLPTGGSPPTKASTLTDAAASGHAYFRVVIELGIEIAEALHAAHEYGVVHRDVKPSNLLLDQDGKVWVTDFGLARLPSDASLTRTGDVVGTMQYMSPEQASGDAALVDQRTDVYSLGATLYELVALRPPHVGGGRAARLDVEPPRLRHWRPDIPRDLETVIHKALARNRDERYMTARELAEDLRRVLAGRPTIARPPSPLDRLTKWAHRHERLTRVAVVIGLIALASLVTGFVLITREKQRAEQNYFRAQENLQVAIRAVDELGGQLAERLADVPGAALVRRELLQQTREFYEQLASRSPNDPMLRTELAVTCSKLARITEQLGSTREAIELYRRALDWFKNLEDVAPDSIEHQRQFARCLNGYGLALRGAGQSEEAKQAFLGALQRQERLVAGKSVPPDCLADLGRTQTNLGLLYLDLGYRTDAENALRESVRLQEQVVLRQNSNLGARRDLAAALNSLASLYQQDRPADAERLFGQALEQSQKVAAADPDDLKAKAELARTFNNLGTLQASCNRPVEAAANYAQAIRIQREIEQVAPSTKSSRHDLAVTWNNQGMAQQQLRQFDEAERSFRLALDLEVPLLQQDSGDVELRSSVGGIYNNLGMTLEDQGRWDEAAAAFERAIEHQQIACHQAPAIARYVAHLNKHYFNYGRALRRQSNFEKAMEVCLARRDLNRHHAERLVSVAEELVSVWSAMQDAQTSSSSNSGVPEHEMCLELVFETLRMAIAAGYPPAELKKRSGLAAVQNDPRFGKTD